MGEKSHFIPPLYLFLQPLLVLSPEADIVPRFLVAGHYHFNAGHSLLESDSGSIIRESSDRSCCWTCRSFLIIFLLDAHCRINFMQIVVWVLVFFLSLFFFLSLELFLEAGVPGVVLPGQRILIFYGCGQEPLLKGLNHLYGNWPYMQVPGFHFCTNLIYCKMKLFKIDLISSSLTETTSLTRPG